jgi:hypothetical protein
VAGEPAALLSDLIYFQKQKKKKRKKKRGGEHSKKTAACFDAGKSGDRISFSTAA